MKRALIKNNFLKAIGSLSVISIIIIAITIFLINEEAWIGPFYLVLAAIGVITLDLFNVELKAIYPDLIFGIIDNGVLVLAAVLGARYAGVAGAILGGAAGNTITDGIGGLFEGRMAESLEKKGYKSQRNSLSTTLGKIIGCLIGAGIGLLLVWTFKMIF